MKSVITRSRSRYSCEYSGSVLVESIRDELSAAVCRDTEPTDRPSGCRLSVRGAAGRPSEARGEEGKVRGVRGRRQEGREAARKGGKRRKREEQCKLTRKGRKESGKEQLPRTQPVQEFSAGC